MKDWITGIDIGGTHITVCQVNPATGVMKEESMTRYAVDPSLGADLVIKNWAAAIKACLTQAGMAAGRLGIAMPGPFDYEKGISYIKGLSKYESLYGLPVKKMLAEELGIVESDISMMNDALAYVRGECALGCARGARDVLGITLGTGLGSAIYRKGMMVEGDLYCFPFREGMAEDYCSARWFLRSYEAKTGLRLKGVKELALRANDELEALALFQEFGTTLGEILLSRYAEKLPSTLVIGGNIARAWYLFLPTLKEKLNDRCEIKLASLGEAAALIGASFCAAEN